MTREWLGRILRNEKRGGGYCTLSLEIPPRFSVPSGGQFVMLSVGREPEILLRRPMAIYDIAPKGKKKVLSILYSVVGKGTAQIAALPKGGALSFLGPLGNHFSRPGRAKTAVIAGGIGIAPFLLWGRGLSTRERDHTRIYFGFRTRDQRGILADFARNGLEPLVAIEGPGGDFHGTVVDFFNTERREFQPELVLACGPSPMIDAVRRICARERIPLEVSLEAKMACGLGACLSCVTDLVPGPQPGGYALVCRDGPVFRFLP